MLQLKFVQIFFHNFLFTSSSSQCRLCTVNVPDSISLPSIQYTFWFILRMLSNDVAATFQIYRVYSVYTEVKYILSIVRRGGRSPLPTLVHIRVHLCLYLFRYTGYTYCSAHPCIHHTSGTCLFRLLWWHEFRLFFLKKCPVKWVIAVVFKDISSLMCCSCSFKKKSSKMSFGCSFQRKNPVKCLLAVLSKEIAR